MDEEFESFVVTDPDIVDPTIDVSGLRTQTDTSLLGSIPNFAGIQYEAFNPTRLTDLMRLYSTGLPMIDTPAAAVPPATGDGGTGGGGTGDRSQATTPVDTTPIDTSIINEGIQSAEDDKGDVMLEDFEMANMGGITSDPIDIGIPDNESGFIDPLITQAGAPDVFDINQTGDPTTTMLDVPTDTVGLAYTGEFDPDDEGTVFDTTAITPEDTEQSITQKVADFLGVDASKINKAAVTGALNLVAGKAANTVIPIATVFNLITDSFTKSSETPVDDFDTTGVNPFKDIDTGVGEFDTGTNIVDEVALTGGDTENIFDEVALTGGLDPDRGQQIDRGTSGAGDDQPVTTTTKPGELKTSTYDAELEDDRDTGGGGNTGGKIVCTMMNESYGFGSFRNKIWMKFHKDLSPEYQKGYHKLFLPLVKIAKKNIIVKKVLEHIAVHSTIDMRQSMRGKTHLLGRIYRKILLPLCYWVGKNG